MRLRVTSDFSASDREVDLGNKLAGFAERTIHPLQDEPDGELVDRQLAVGEQLDQHAAQEIVVRAADRCDIGRLEPRRKIGEPDLPTRRVGAAGDQHVAFGLARQVDEMEHRPLVEIGTRCILDHQRIAIEKRRHPLDRQLMDADAVAVAVAAPDLCQVALAAAGRAGQHQHPVRPVGPAIDRRQRRVVGIGDQEVVAAARLDMRQIEGQLALQRVIAAGGRHHQLVSRFCPLPAIWAIQFTMYCAPDTTVRKPTTTLPRVSELGGARQRPGRR